jgi:hypothetical protein
MKFKLALLLSLLFLCILPSCYTVQYTAGYEALPTTKNQNVCGFLKDSVIVYAIFVDAAGYHPWTEFDIESTLDSVNKAMSWVEQKAHDSNNHVGINVVQHKQSSKWSFPERKARTTLRMGYATSTKRRHIVSFDSWADAIAKYAGKSVKKATGSKVGTRNKVINAERLIANLRDRHETENVALMFFVNGYYENNPSYSFNTETNGPDIEYSIITNKNPAVIAHEFLHLFGAIDLYPTARYSNFNSVELRAAYPNEVMLVQHREITKLEISPITRYFLGWQEALDKPNTRLLYHKSNFVVY